MYARVMYESVSVYIHIKKINNVIMIKFKSEDLQNLQLFLSMRTIITTSYFDVWFFFFILIGRWWQGVWITCQIINLVNRYIVWLLLKKSYMWVVDVWNITN